MRRVLFVAVVSVVAACGKNDKPEQQQSKPAGDDIARVSNHALATAPLVATSAAAGQVAFTIQLPMSLLKPAKTESTNVSWEPKQAWMDTPDVSVTFIDMPLAADSTGEAIPFGEDAADREIARAEKLADGGYIHLDQRKDHKFFELEVCRPVTGGKLCCSLSQRAQQPIEAFAEIVALGEKVCTSMKAQ